MSTSSPRTMNRLNQSVVQVQVFSLLTLPGRAGKGWPCRGSCALSILGRGIISLRQAYGSTGVMNRGDQREDT
jgi:hypothetical protein